MKLKVYSNERNNIYYSIILESNRVWTVYFLQMCGNGETSFWRISTGIISQAFTI